MHDFIDSGFELELLDAEQKRQVFETQAGVRNPREAKVCPSTAAETASKQCFRPCKKGRGFRPGQLQRRYKWNGSGGPPGQPRAQASWKQHHSGLALPSSFKTEPNVKREPQSPVLHQNQNLDSDARGLTDAEVRH